MKLHSRLCLSLAAGMAVAICGSQAFQHYKLQRLFAEVGDQNVREVKQRLSDNIESVERAVEFGIAQALGNGGNSLLTNKALLAKTQFPRECFPLETMLVTALNTVISWIPLALLFVIFGRAPKVATVWVPMFMVIEVVFAAGITLAVSSLIIQMRDLQQVLPIIISLGIFMTPVIWPFSYIPTHYHLFGGTEVAGHWIGGVSVNLQAVYGFFNPLGPVINGVRQTMLLGHNPSWWPLAAAAVGSLCYLLFGYRIFKRFEVNFADIA